LPWDPATPYKGLGFREIAAARDDANYALSEFPVVKA